MTEQEFTALVEELRPELVKIAARRCGRDQAEDAVQIATTQIWIAQQWLTYDRERMAGLLRQAAARKAINELRGLGRLRDAQRNLDVLGNSGCEHVPVAATSDYPEGDNRDTGNR
jgi:DNA-directed RNA polymerase specialized sigma24 family protein